ncbi:hypothetical protein FSP39_002653 [Pinctada imbricata]|uniref:Uncharacterized protein n=1 Tax=Pinctada imbricata TaxID=66713 RepID=A0AA88XVE7_PINIB|nr:hypothetical protein FSP39_002653 [Pinctada imbricata]
MNKPIAPPHPFSDTSVSGDRNGNVVPIITGRQQLGKPNSGQYFGQYVAGQQPAHTNPDSPSFSTFHPRGQQNISRPESSTSISSYCSTGSSVLSVIHRPNAGKSSSPVLEQSGQRGQGPKYPNMLHINTNSYQTNAPNSINSDPYYSNVSSAAKNNTHESDRSPDQTGKPPPGNTRGTSPKSILNNSPSCLRTNSKGKKPQKRVSFSDSEPSDLESPSGRVPNRISPVNSAIANQKPEDFLSPLERLNKMINKPGHQGYQGGSYGNQSAPSAMTNFYMNGSVKSGVAMNNGNGQLNTGHLSQNPSVVGPTHTLGGSSINGPSSTTSDRIKMLYSGQGTRTKSQVLQSSKC